MTHPSRGRLHGYHRPEAFSRRLAELQDEAGARAALEVFGYSVEQRRLVALTVAGEGRRPAPTRPQAMVVAAIHGNEVISSELALRLLEMACDGRPSGPVAELLDVADLVVVPVVNPDGRARSLASLETGGLWRSAPRRNANGVDLNRNWPFPAGVEDHWSPLAGTSVGFLPWYRGRRPLCEPETEALDRLVDQRRPFVLLNLHSTGQIITYPWSCKEEPPADLAGFQAMIAAFNGAQTRWRYRSKQSRAWYPIIGSSNDWFYDRYGVLAMTVEIGTEGAAVRRDPRRARYLFWYANPTDLEAHLGNDADACFAAMRAAHDYRQAS